MSTRTIQCRRCSKLAKVDRSAPAKQLELTYCNACYEAQVASGAVPRARATRSSGGPRKPKRAPRPRETVEQGGGLYSASDTRPTWKSGLTDMHKIHEILRQTPGAEGGEITCQRAGCEQRTRFPAGTDPGRIQRGWCETCWSKFSPAA